MKHRFVMPPIPESERTPLVIALLKDEILILKGGKKRPHFKPSKMEEQTEEVQRGEGSAKDQRRAGSDKRSKTAELV